MSIWGSIDSNLAQLAVIGVLVLLGLLIKVGIGYLQLHTKNKMLLIAEGEAKRVLDRVVGAASNTALADLKAKNNGALTKEDLQKIKDDVLGQVQSQLSQDTIDVLSQVKGDLPAYLSSLYDGTDLAKLG